MDFAAILAREISKKRKPSPPPPAADAPTTATTTTTTAPPPKKYLKRSEVETQRRAAYEAQQAALEAQRAAKAAQKRAADDADFQRREATRAKAKALADARRAKADAEKALTTPATTTAAADTPQEPGAEEMTEEEATAGLRALGEPARLFGEGAAGRVRRLKRCRAAAEARRAEEAPALTADEMVLDMKDVGVDDGKVYRQLGAWFALVLREWEMALEGRPEAVKESFQGKAAARSMQQAKLYMAPLFVHFRKRDLKTELYTKICEIVVEAQARRYVKANDLYLRLSIGNAAWPIGVTMVGIHERSAREKLHEKGMAAHIMSDEVTRKFLQSIKRCLSFCQTRWIPEDPLQMMG
ncbi:Prp18 domain-containing protein [Morchella snyderi]|nr:Prp18 domain-containing protein [Morchella snyderi]